MNRDEILKSVQLSDEQAKAYMEKLGIWKKQIEEQKEKELEFFKDETEKKIEEKYNSLFEDAKKKLQTVSANRLEEALKNLYDTVKEKSLKDLKESAEYQAFNKLKSLVAPFIVETGMKETVDAKASEIKALKDEINKLQAVRKFEVLSKDLEESVRVELKKLMGDLVSEEQVVEEFSKAVKIMKLTKKTLEDEAIEENIDPVDKAGDPVKAILPSPEKEKDGKKKKAVSESAQSDEDDEDDEDDDIEDIDLEDDEEEIEGEDDEDDIEDVVDDEDDDDDDVEVDDEEGDEEDIDLDDEGDEDDAEMDADSEEDEDDGERKAKKAARKAEDDEDEIEESLLDDILSEKEEGAIVTKGKQEVINESSEENEELNAEISRMRVLSGIEKKR